MRARLLVGAILLLLGVASLGVGLYNFNQFFFVEKRSTWDRVLGALPLYATWVAVPIMVGLILVIDGRIIYRLKRTWTLQIHLISNLIWFYATKMVYDLFSEPATDPQRYQQVFQLMAATLFLFILGSLIDSIPSRKKAKQ